MSVKGINFKHGHTLDYSETREYATWCRMKERCYNKNSKFYKGYGGRGITVCKRWLNSFSSFYKDMGDRPSQYHSLDRINNNKGYSKSNCKWGTKKEQANNRRSCILITYMGKTMTMKQWAEFLGLKYKRVHKRIHYFGWPIEQAFNPNKFRGSMYYKSRNIQN